MTKLKPCPWCGRVPVIRAETEEVAPYKPHPRPAGYSIEHISLGDEDDCPIATFPGQTLGTWQYDTEEEAADAWNARA